MQIRTKYLCPLFTLLISYTLASSQQCSISIDLKKEIGEMKPVWAWFGYDEPNYTYMKDGKKLLSPPVNFKVDKGILRLKLLMPRQAVSLIKLSW